MGRYWDKMSVNDRAALDAVFEKAKAGRELWLSLSEKHNIDSDCGVIVFPVRDDELNREAISLLSAYMERFHLRQIYAVTDQESVIETIKGMDCHEIMDIGLSETEMDNLLKYYRMAEFTAHIAVVSIDKPFGNDYLIKKKGLSMQDFILSAIFKMR